MTASLVIALATLALQGAAPRDEVFVPGTPLPALRATTLAGEELALPGDASAHGAILVIGFSKDAADVTREWMEFCLAATRQPGHEAVACYDVRMVEEVPRLFRGMMEKGMKKSYPLDRQRRTLMVYTDNDAWRARLGARDTATAYIVGCDATGRVRLTATGPFLEAELKAILDAIAPSPGAPAAAR